MVIPDPCLFFFQVRLGPGPSYLPKGLRVSYLLVFAWIYQIALEVQVRGT